MRTSAKHQSAPSGKKVRTDAQPFRVAPIGTCPAPEIETDLLGHEIQKQTNDRPEAAALVEVMQALRAHPAVSWAERMNSGAARIGARFVRFGWPGCPDVLGQLRDDRLLGVEVKSPQAGKLRPEQTVFLERIRCAGGVAFMARRLPRRVARIGNLQTNCIFRKLGNP